MAKRIAGSTPSPLCAATQPVTGGNAPGTAPTMLHMGVRRLSGVYAPTYDASAPLSDSRLVELWAALEGIDGVLYGEGMTNYTGNPLQSVDEKYITARIDHRLSDNDQIFLDSGTTCFEIARQLKRRRGLTVIVNSARLAIELDSRQPARIDFFDVQGRHAGRIDVPEPVPGLRTPNRRRLTMRNAATRVNTWRMSQRETRLLAKRICSRPRASPNPGGTGLARLTASIASCRGTA
jgi:hypothetical protein